MGVLVTLTSYLSINIVKRKRSEESLEKALRDTSESEDRLQCFFDAAFEGIAISKNGKFIDGNKRFSSMFGYEYEEMLGMSIKGLVHKDDWELVLKNIESNYEEAYEHRSIHKDGSIRYLQVHGQSTQFEGCTVRITAVNDITDRKKAERELIEAYKYQTSRSRMEALGNFATGIAHDFNNALTPILGNCELLLADMQGECKPIYIPRVRSIMAAAETASLLVHRMQTFTRDSDSLENIAPLRIQSCLIETFKFLRSIIPTSVVIETHIEEPLRVVRANDITLRQILMNLCKNSSQSMEDETGEISIDVCNEEIVVERFGLTKGKYISITVEDNGRGMSPEVLDKALDPYFTTKPVGEGTGIGLSVVNNIVRGYGGIVRIYSEEENGTKVVIYIPAVEDSESVKECRINVEIILGNKEQVLLVDDEPSVIGATASLVESLNYIVTPFTSGIEALAEFEMNPDKYELVITDLTMPVMTGVELINEIRKIRPEIKIILCSGLGSNGKRAADMTADPINGYLSKPVTRADYSTVLSSVLKKEG
jgi:PAS domain S-box-containing protein